MYFRPIIFSVVNPSSFEAALVMATLSEMDDSTSQESERPQVNELSRLQHVRPQQKSSNLRHSTQRSTIGDHHRRSQIQTPGLTPIEAAEEPMRPTPPNSTPINRQCLITPNRKSSARTPLAGAVDDESGHADSPIHRQCLITPRRPSSERTPMAGGVVDDGSGDAQEAEEVPASPPSKKTKFYFRRCFDATFNPINIPGYQRVLARDSDEENM